MPLGEVSSEVEDVGGSYLSYASLRARGAVVERRRCGLLRILNLCKEFSCSCAARLHFAALRIIGESYMVERKTRGLMPILWSCDV